MNAFQIMVEKVRSCRICEAHLPHGVRPVFQMDPEARILIVGQAPGRRVHETGIPFNDVSGDRLREWLGVTREVFYNQKHIALLPMGFCFPGKGKAGDLPPRPECVRTWRKQLLSHLKHLKLTMVLGQYAQAYHLGDSFSSVTQAVQAWRTYAPEIFPLPHPSPRNILWVRRHPWFEKELLPVLRARVSQILTGSDRRGE